MTLTLEQAKIVYDGLKHGYKGVESRMQFNRSTKHYLEDPDVCMHLLGYKIPAEISSNVPMYADISAEVKDLLDPYINRTLNVIEAETKSVDQIFLIMSTNWCGSSRHVKHLHTLLQRDPDRCITYSIPLPLYIDPADDRHHKFHWHYSEDLYPKITYTSHQRMEKIDTEYMAVDIPKTAAMSLIFDSARVPHYIDNTGHLYLWVVCDATVFEGQLLHSGLKLDLHQGII